MKKIILLFSLFATLCAQSGFCATEAEFKAKQDTLSMTYGQYFGSVISLMHKQNPQLDINEFMKGLDQIMSADTSNVGLLTGLSLGTEILNEVTAMKMQKGVNLNRDLLVAEVKKAVVDTSVNREKMYALNSDMRVLSSRVEEMAIAFSPMCKQNKAKGETYIAQKATSKEGFKKTASGLLYKVVNKGNGKNFAETDNVLLKYKGTHVNGEVFDQSKDTVTFVPTSMVPGFKEAMLMMSPGSKMIVVLPSDLAYGDRGAGKDRSGNYTIQPGETLVFEIETYGVKAEEAKPDAVVSAEPAAAAPAGKTGIRAKGGKPAKPATNQQGKKK